MKRTFFLKFELWRNHGKIVLTLLVAAAIVAFCPRTLVASPKIRVACQNADKKFSGKQDTLRGDEGDAPLGLLPPLGERGGQPHTRFKI